MLAIGACQAQVAGDDVAVDAPGRCASQRPIFVTCDGLMLTQGTASDSTTNTAQWLPVATANVPAYRATTANRAALVDEVASTLARSLPTMPIVATRPTAGSYLLVVIGGTGTDLGFPNGTNAASHLDCADTNPNDVVWVSDTLDAQSTVDLVVGGIGVAIGLTGTMDSSDCLCGFGNSCVPNAQACTLSTSIAADPKCAGSPTTQDEAAAFDHAFCR